MRGYQLMSSRKSHRYSISLWPVVLAAAPLVLMTQYMEYRGDALNTSRSYQTQIDDHTKELKALRASKLERTLEGQ